MADNPTHIKDLTPDPNNRRQHTPRNVGMLVDSLQKVGAGRSIVIDENNEILAGNATIEAAGEAGITKVKVIEADGTEVIAVKRTGLSDQQKIELAMFDNRTAELAEWNTQQLLKDVENGIDLSAFFFEDELKSLSDEAEDIDLDQFFKDGEHSGNKETISLVLKFTEEEHSVVTKALDGHAGTNEQVVMKLLGVS